MTIIYGPNLAESWGRIHLLGTVLMKSYTTYSEKSDVFLSYRHSDQDIALRLAGELYKAGFDVFIDFYDGTLDPADGHIDTALVLAIRNSDTMVIVVSDDTRLSWWVPWEIGVSTPYKKPRAIYTLGLRESLPTYLSKLRHLRNPMEVSTWVGVQLSNR